MGTEWISMSKRGITKSGGWDALATRIRAMNEMGSPLPDLIDLAVHGSITDARPRGAVVSGGVDSSTVVAFARGHDPHLPTFTGWYDEPGCDERYWARLVTGPNHHEIQITPQDFIDNFDAMIPHFDRPFMGMGTFGQYMVAKYIAENTDCKVILSGEGADELFGGYARLMAVAGVPLPDGYENYQIPDGYPRDLEAALLYDWHSLSDLLAVDRQALGAFGIEARSPFLDSAIVDYAFNLPATSRVGKKHLKQAVRGIVPDEILDRTDKRGFPAPLVKWAQGPLRDFVGDRLGYIPDPGKPWDRGWWVELCEKTKDALPIAA